MLSNGEVQVLPFLLPTGAERRKAAVLTSCSALMTGTCELLRTWTRDLEDNPRVLKEASV